MEEVKSAPSEATVAKPKMEEVKPPSREKTKEVIVPKTAENPKEKTTGNHSRNDSAKPNEKPKEQPAKTDSARTKTKPKTNPVRVDTIGTTKNLASNKAKPAIAKEKPVLKSTAKTENVKPATPKQADEVVFRIQIAASSKELSSHSSKFAGLPDVWRYEHQGMFKFTTGRESSPEALASLVAEVKKKGFPDAFIVAFHGKERITVAEAKQLILEK